MVGSPWFLNQNRTIIPGMYNVDFNISGIFWLIYSSNRWWRWFSETQFLSHLTLLVFFYGILYSGSEKVGSLCADTTAFDIILFITKLWCYLKEIWSIGKGKLLAWQTLFGDDCVSILIDSCTRFLETNGNNESGKKLDAGCTLDIEGFFFN